MPINTHSLQVLHLAYPESIKEIFGELRPNFLSDSFLPLNNFFKGDAAKLVEEQFCLAPRNRKKFLSKHSGQYIAASTLLHNMDGWTYFGHAVNALLRGDNRTARHLLYYSELRSCMSFLASNGVGVFNNRHLIIDRTKKVNVVNAPIKPNNARSNTLGTHDFAWEAFQYLVNQDKFALLLLKNFKVDGIQLNEWLEKFGIHESNLVTISQSFLRQLSFDLSHFSNDKHARNEASYRPKNMFQNEKHDFINIFNDIMKIWKYSEPISTKGEITIDIILLTILLQLSFKHTHSHNKHFLIANKQYLRKIDSMLDSFGLSDARKSQLRAFFNSKQEDIYISLNITDLNSSSFINGMLFRSYLFLRVSNCYVNSILKEHSDIDKDTLIFWWNNLGINYGLWEENSEPENFQDLWEDINLAFEDINDVVINSNSSTTMFWQKYSNLGFLFSTCNRIGLWGLGV